jgi:hypothetical protein
MDPAHEELISLREAAKISGYSPDYIGQLIRSGKIPGKQVFSNVAWMTTEEAVLAHMAKSGKGVASQKAAKALLEKLASPELLTRIYLVASWCVVILLGSFILFLGYVFAVSVDHRIEQRSLEHAPYVR